MQIINSIIGNCSFLKLAELANDISAGRPLLRIVRKAKQNYIFYILANILPPLLNFST